MTKKPHYLLQFFAYEHLPFKLQPIVSPFKMLAENLDNTLPDNDEKSLTLNSLLISKENSIKSFINKPTEK